MYKPWYQHIENLPTIKGIWQELYDKANAKTIDKEHISEVRRIYAKAQSLHNKAKVADKPNHELFHKINLLHTQIREQWNKYGFPSYDDITYHNGDKVGLLDLLGNKLTDAIYDEFSFTFDLDVFLFNYYIVAKKNGKWGIVNRHNDVICPFEYDFIIQVPETTCEFLLIKNGKEGIFYNGVIIPCEMDSIHIPNYITWPFFLQKNGKWGWYWDNNNLYNNLQQPLYDEIYFMTQKEWETLTDDDEEFFEARIDDKIHYILMWSYK